MPIRRRLLLASGAVLLAPRLVRAARAQRADARMNERALGSPDAKLTVQEWFSLTCTHCAHFSNEVFPEVRQKLIDTGRIRFVFRDFPLDQLALAAAMVARALPPDRYVPFVETLFATQQSWAFGPDPVSGLARQAELAGMSNADFQALAKDQTLQQGIVSERDDGNQRYTIEGTPTFIFGDTKIGPIQSYDDFLAAVNKVSPAG